MSNLGKTPSRRGLFGLAAAGGVVMAAPALVGRARAAPPPLSSLECQLRSIELAELYKDINAAYASYWKQRTGQTIEIKQSRLADRDSKPGRSSMACRRMW